jgi:hypothetical protein
MIGNKKNRFLIVLVLLTALYGAYWFFLGAYYSFPNAEDISLTKGHKNFSVRNEVLNLLLSYDGRYFTNVLHSANPLTFGKTDYYKYSNMFSILFFFMCLYLLFSQIILFQNKVAAFAFSLMFLVLNFTLSPSLVHELYWLVSSYVYLYAWCFWMIWISLFLAAKKTNLFLKSTVYYAFSNLFLFLSIGINEMFLVINTLSLFLLALYEYYTYKKLSHPLFSLIIVSGFSILFFISSPGISRRLSLFDEGSSYSFLEVLKYSFSHFFEEGYRVLFSSYATIGLFGLIILKGFQTKVSFKLNKVKLLFFSLFCFVGLYLMTMPFYLTMGVKNLFFPNRIFTAVDTGFLLLGVLISFYISELIANKISKDVVLFFKTIFITILIYGLFFQVNNISLLKAEYNNGTLLAYKKEMTERFETINKSKENKTCWKKAIIKPLVNKPKSIYFDPDIKPNREDEYWNEAYESYFFIDEISYESDTSSKLENLKAFFK